jgi:hypothetical protein
MKKCTLFLVVMLFTGLGVSAEKVVLPELLDPNTIAVDKDQIFITDGVSVYIYSLTDFGLKKKFGKKGEGPREFLAPPQTGGLRLDVQPDYILINSIGKVSYFSRTGEFQKVIKGKAGFAVYRPLGSQFAGLGFAQDNNLVYTTVNIYDSQLEKVKEIHRQKGFFQMGRKMNPLLKPPGVLTSGTDRIIVNTRIDGIILVFNGKGEKHCTITHDYEKFKLTDEHKKAILHFYKTDPRIKDNWGYIKDKIEFPTAFPEVQSFTVNNNKVYAQTHRREENKAEFFIFDLDNGKFLKKVFLPFADKNPFVEISPYTVNNDVFYQLVENAGKEKWELHIHPVK